MITLHHKKNELFEVEFFADKKCTIPFDFTNAKNLYVELKNGDIAPIFKLHILGSFNIFTPYIPQSLLNECKNGLINTYIKTLNDIPTDLSKYIPEDNAVLFLSEESCDKYADNCDAWFLYQKDFPKRELNNEMDIRDWKKLTIFLQHLTQAELQKANEVEKELKEKYGVEEVNLCTLHCFVKFQNLCHNNIKLSIALQYDIDNYNYNKIITTNSTGVLPVPDNERLQVIDSKEIFEEYLKNN